MDAEIKTALDTLGGAVKTANDQRAKEIADLQTQAKNLGESVEALRKALKATHQQVYSSGVYRGAFANEESAKAFGHFVLASCLGRDGSRKFLDENKIELKTQVEGTPASGGYLVPTTLATQVLDLVATRYGVFRRNCYLWPGTPDTIPTQSADVTVYVPGEASQITPSDVTLSYASLTYKKWTTLTLISSELDEDAVVAVGDLVANSIARAIGLKEDACGFVGDGSGTYFSITGLASAINASMVAETASATLTALTYDDLLQVIGLLPEKYHAGAAFYGSISIWSLCRGVKDANGNQAVATIEAGGAAVRPQMTLLGYPFHPCAALPTRAASTAGVKFLYFGDLRSAAVIAQKRQLMLARSTEFKFDYDVVALRSTERKAIAIVNAGSGGAMTALKLKSGS